jgi:aminodeoxyfutalosine deaminase
MILRARIVVPVNRPPIEDGAVCLAGERIAWVGRRAEVPASFSGAKETDLGEVILLPGLVNAHCHLDYTGMAGQLSPPKSFTDWIKSMVMLKGTWSLDEFATSWKQGAAMLLRTGTTTVVDIEAVPELIPQAWSATPLRVISFRELINVRSRQPASELVERAVNDWLGLANASGRVGLSPHAPYTASPELLELSARAAHRRQWRLTTHLAESEEEFEMFMYRQGAMFDWLKSQRDMSDCGRGSPVQHLERCGYLDENLLAVHVNYLLEFSAVTR